MPNINDAFPSRFLKAPDLQDREVVVKMKRVNFEEVLGEKKAVLYFEGHAKGLVLNKTNAKKIIDIAGSALTEDWTGVEIKLYPTETSFQGEMVECIRVKSVTKNGAGRLGMTPVAPPTMREDTAPLTDDDIPF